MTKDPLISMHKFAIKSLVATVALSLFAFEAAKAQDPPEDPPGMLDEMLTKIPKQDLSWVVGRTVVGPELWDNASAFVPKTLRTATLPGYESGRLLGDEDLSEDMDSWSAGNIGRGRALGISKVLSTVTKIITMAGTAVMGVFAIFFIIQQVYGFGKNAGGVTIGWAPARLGASLLFLMPVSKDGFCAIQALVVVCVQIGIGAANITWDKAVSLFNTIGDEIGDETEKYEDVLDISSEKEKLVVDAMSTGICRAIMEVNGEDPDCGGLLDQDETFEAIDQIGRIYDVPDISTFLKDEIYTPRRDILEEIVESTEKWAKKNLSLTDLNLDIKRVHPLADSAKTGEPINILDIKSVEIGSEEEEDISYFIPINTQVIWSALDYFGGGAGVAGCLGIWADKTRKYGSKKPLPSDRIHAALKQEDRGVVFVERFFGHGSLTQKRNDLSFIPARWWERMGLGRSNRVIEPEGRAVDALWPLDGWDNFLKITNEPGKINTALKSNRIKNCTNASIDSKFRRWAMSLNEVDTTGFTEHIRPVYSKQLSGVSGDDKGGGRRGWLMAGALFWQIQMAQRTDTSIRNVVTPTFSGINPDKCSEEIKDKDMTSLNNEDKSEINEACLHVRAWNIGILTSETIKQTGNIYPPDVFSYNGEEGVISLDNTYENTNSIAKDLVVFFENQLKKAAETNTPLIEIMNMGSNLMTAAFVAKAISFFGSVISRIPGPIEKISDGLKSANALFWPLLGIGLALGVWLPALPLMAWLSAIWAWIVSIILALLAAPLWALAHAIPDGHGPLSQYSRKGYELLLFATLRPMFLVAGLLLAITMSSLIVKIGSIMFSGVISSYINAVEFINPSWAGEFINSILIVFMAIIFVGAIFFLVHKTFSLCHEVADRTFEWIGQGASLGDQQILGEMRQALIAAGSKTTAVGTGLLRSLPNKKKPKPPQKKPPQGENDPQ